MIKFILIAFLSFALSGTVIADDRADELAEFNKDCQIAGSVKVKLSVIVPPGACGCPEDEGNGQDKCLGVENSEKISDAVLNILEKNGHSIEVINALQLTKFLAGGDYGKFAKNIKENDFEFEGFGDLKELVNEFKVCKKECKVYFTLRKALREGAAQAADLELLENDNGGKTLFVKGGNLIVLSDTVNEVQARMLKEDHVTEVVFQATTFFADSNLFSANWHGKHLVVEATNFVIIPPEVVWDVTAFGDESDGAVDLRGIQAWDKGANGNNKLTIYPTPVEP